MLAQTIDRSVAWLATNGWSGWDPYDVWDSPVGKWASSRRTLARRLGRYVLSTLQLRYPLAVRRTLRIAPRVNAKGMGLFAAAFVELERLEGSARLIDGQSAYEPCFEWLEANMQRAGDGFGWGYPFTWQSRLLIPSGTPTVVTSAVIGDAYWLRYTYSADLTALRRCEEICHFILTGLNRTNGPDGSFCFSYTPIDRLQVHNANLLGAEFLARIGRATGRTEWVNLAIAAGRFSMFELREDGTLGYWSNAQARGAIQQDTYHSGFEIRALHGLARATGYDAFGTAASRYLQTWLADFFQSDGTPHLARGDAATVEVHSCAEAILCAAMLGNDEAWHASTPFEDHVRRSLSSALSYLWVPTGPEAGFFAWRARRGRSSWRRAEIPMIRWGQAWMLNAMAKAGAAIRSAHDGARVVPS